MRGTRHRSRLLVVALAVVFASAAGCATQADIQSLRTDHRSIRGQLADTRASLEALQREVAQLRGRVDEVRHSTRGGRQQVATDLSNLEARIAALEQERATPLTATHAGGSRLPAAADAEQRELAVGDLAREEGRPDVPEDYRRALSLARQNQCDRAIPVFREFLSAHPESAYVPNAHYWIGDCYYVLGDYYQAILKFNDVRQQYPTSDRAAPALLKIGLAFLEMGNKSEARLAFQKVVNDYPSLPEAVKAREKLQALGT